MSFNSKALFSLFCLAVVSTPISNAFAQGEGGIPGIKPAVVTTEMSEEEAIKKATLFLVYNQLGPMVAQMKAAGIELDKEQAQEAFRRAFAGEPLGITAEEVRPAMEMIQAKFQEKQMARQQEMMAKMKEVATKNQAEGDAYLAENAKKEGVKTLEGGVQYEVIVEGTGPKPTPNSKVKINYHGTYLDGKVFDSTIEKQPGKPAEPIEINTGIFVKGFQTALHAMPVGSKWKVSIPGDQAYGMQGRPPRIGPNQTIIFELELLEILESKEVAPGSASK